MKKNDVKTLSAFLALLIIAFLACSKKGDVIEAPVLKSPPIPYPVLKSFTVEIVNTDTTSARIEWTSATEAVTDSVTYTLQLDSIEVASKLKVKEYTLKGLKPNQKYSLIVKAVDTRNN